MRKMKDSGIEWIGDIPEEWDIGKIKNYYTFQTGFTPDTKNENYYDDDGFDWVTIGDLDGNYYIPSVTKRKISKQYIDKFIPSVISKGSLLYSFKLSLGQVAFADREVYSNEAIACFDSNPNCNLNFLYYSSFLIEENANINIYGAKLLNQELIQNAIIVFPPLDEQAKIASCLYDKCNKVHNIINNIESQIEKLKAYKQSLITEVVTKGLNPDVEMKDSGVEWIGEVPTHWDIIPMKRKFVFGKGLPITKVDLIIEGAPVISYGQIHAKNNTGVSVKTELLRYVSKDFYNTHIMSLGKCGDIFIADTSEDYDGIGDAILIDKNDIFAGYHTIIAKPVDERNSKYFAYLMLSDIWRNQLRVNASGIKVFSVTLGMLKKIDLLLPPYEEQASIIEKLDKECATIDRLLELKHQKIDKLNQYKKSLIYEYVTGKKEAV